MTDKEITDYVFIEDSNPKGDVALVFGTGHSWKIATDTAVELYKKGLVPKIIFSGGVNRKTGIIESEIMTEEAVKLGVLKEDVIVEDKSSNTLENVLFSIEKMKTEIGLPKIKAVVGVVKNYHSRRALMTLRKHLPADVEIKSAPYVSILYKFTKDNWHETDVGREQVLGEKEKIGLYLAKGDLAEL